MTSVWFVAAAHGRHATVAVALKQWRHICGELDRRGLNGNGVLVADDENLDIAAEHGFHTVDRGNHDVGAKYNAGFRYAYEHGADVVVYTGSDNWVHPDLFGRLPRERRLMTGSLIQVVDVPTSRMRLCRIDTVYGTIPWLIPRSLLDSCHGEPIDEHDLKRGFDGAIIRGLTRANGWPPTFTRFDPHEFARVDFKTADNLTSYGRITRDFGAVETTDPWNRLRDWYPPDLVAEAHRLVGQS